MLEPTYDLVERQAEVEILPMAGAHEIAVVPCSPAADGLLSGKYAGAAGHAGAGGSASRLHPNRTYRERYGEEGMHDTTRRFARFCGERGLHPVGAAVA